MKFVIVILFLIVFIAPLIIHNIVCYDFVKKYDIKNIDKIKWRTGDLICFKWDYNLMNIDKKNNIHLNYRYTFDIMSNIFMCYLFNARFVHYGVVVIYDDTPYVLEMSLDEKYCNYVKEKIHFKPTLSSLDEINIYNGPIVRVPYVGKKVSDKKIEKLLCENHKYSHGFKNLNSIIHNFKSYVKSSKINEFNCVQYTCYILNSFGNNLDINIYPNELFDKIEKSKLYSNPHLIYNEYLEKFCL